MRRMRACEWALRRSLAYAMRGRTRSSAYFVSPVTLAQASILGSGRQITLKSCLASLIVRRGWPRHGPPHPPTLGRAPAKPWRASGLRLDVSPPGPTAQGCQLDGVENLRVASAAAEVAGQGLLHLLA